MTGRGCQEQELHLPLWAWATRSSEDGRMGTNPQKFCGQGPLPLTPSHKGRRNRCLPQRHPFTSCP